MFYYMMVCQATNLYISLVFFFNDRATTEIYTLSLHDALPIFGQTPALAAGFDYARGEVIIAMDGDLQDRKSTRLNSSHLGISYAVCCSKKKQTLYFCTRFFRSYRTPHPSNS